MLSEGSERLSSDRKKGIERLIWILNGILNHNLTLKRLLKVAKVHQRLGQVPNGYDFETLMGNAQTPSPDNSPKNSSTCI